MEGWQRNHVRNHFPHMLHRTICSSTFLTSLFTDGVISNEELMVGSNDDFIPTLDENLDTTATTRLGGGHTTKGTTDGTQKMPPRSARDKKDASKPIATVKGSDVENDCILSLTVQQNGGELTRLRCELQAATDQNELLQREADSNSSRNQELSSKIKLLETEGRNCTAECNWLKKELEEARLEISTENKQLQDDNADLRRLILEKDEVVRKQTGEIWGLQRDLKIREDDSKRIRAKLDEARKLANIKSKLLRRQQIEANRKIDSLNNSISEKDNELALFKARHLRDRQGNSRLHLAAKEGDEQSVKALIQVGADVNARNNNFETPILIAASREGDADATVKIAKGLIKAGADAFAVDGEGQTFLHKFASNANPPTSSQFHDISEFLVSKKLTSLFNIQDKGNGRTPFMLAARNADLDKATMALLQTSGIDLSLVDNLGRSYLSYTGEGNKNMNLLAKSNENGSTKHKNLAQAIKDGDEDSVNVLVRLGADVNGTNDDFEPLLHFAASSGNGTFAVNTIKLLINSGANVDAEDNHGNIFLHHFVKPWTKPAQFHELASFLISKDLSRLFNTPGLCRATPFQYAVQIVEIERATLSLLKENGVDFNAVDHLGESVLYRATMHGRSLRLISDLVDLGGNPKHLTDHEGSLLHVAAAESRLELLKFFLDRGLDVNARDKQGKTPLHSIVLRNRKNIIETVQFLLRNGANPDIVDKKGKTPRDYFNEKRHVYPDADQISTCFSLGTSC